MLYTDEQIRQARQTDIAAYISRKGEEIKRCGAGYYLAAHDSLKIRDNMFNWFSQGKSGNAIDFVMIYYGLDFRSAVEELTGEASTITTSTKRYIEPPEEIVMPPRADNERRVLAYLTQKRGLNYELVAQMIRRGLIYQDVKGNCVFAIRDFESNKEIGYELRGTGEQKFCRISAHRGFGFNISRLSEIEEYEQELGKLPEVTRVLLFESAIDLLSYYQLNKAVGSELLVSMGGVNPSVAENLATLYPSAKLIICTDNDEAGNAFAEKYPNAERKLPPECKDWNDYIRARQGCGG